MPSPQSASVPDPFIVEEITTTLYVASARLKILSQETTVHRADNDDRAEMRTQG